MNYIALFFAGAFICNCIPHLCSGLQGQPFPTPFARPRGIGESSPLVNFFWGTANLLCGFQLLSRYPIEFGLNAGAITVALGALALGTHLSRHFARVRAGRVGA